MIGNWLDLGLMQYLTAFSIQEKVLKARLDGKLGPIVILQENYPVFTIGRSGNRDNILSSVEDLQQRGIDVLKVNRGGDVTYHGPGQLVVSPLLYLGDINLNANQYLHRLEDVLIELLSLYNIQASKKNKYPGVWLRKSKIASVGIAVRHGFTFHGFSLNINPDLESFSLINPCGVEKMPVTSMKEVLDQTPLMEDVKIQLRQIMEKTFMIESEEISWPELLNDLKV